MREQTIEKHVEDGIALVDTVTSLFLKAIYHDENEDIQVVLCNTPSQAHIFTDAKYLEDFIDETGESLTLKRRKWLRVPLSRKTQVIGSLSHLYELNNY